VFAGWNQKYYISKKEMINNSNLAISIIIMLKLKTIFISHSIIVPRPTVGFDYRGHAVIISEFIL